MSSETPSQPRTARPAVTEPNEGDVSFPGLLRPYVLTGGRTRATGEDLDIETIVSTASHIAPSNLNLERERIATLCKEPCSIAELASHLDLPLGVARFLASEMVTAGILTKHQLTNNNDNRLIEKLIRGVRAL